MVNMQLSSTNSTDGTRTDRPHTENAAFENGVGEQRLEKDLDLEEQRGTTAQTQTGDVSNNNMRHLDQGKVTTTTPHDDVLAARGLRRIILNFTPS